MNVLRRRLLIPVLACLSAVYVLVWQLPSPAQTPLTLEAAGLTLEQLGQGVYGLIASTDFPASGPNIAICNGSIVIGSDGVLVVDPFQTEALADLLFETVASLTDQPIRYVVNTHYHFDHSGGNAAAAAQDYPILGRGPIREFMLSRNQEQDDNVTPPNVVVNSAGELWLGDRAVQIREFDGHSGGTDLVVYVPDEDVLIAGDLLFTERHPFLGDANIRVLQTNLTQLGVDYLTATIVPGHGPISDRTDLNTLRTYLEELEAIALSWREQGLSQSEAIEQTTIPAQYDDYLFSALFPIALETAYQQITVGNDSTAAIQRYFQAQAPALQAL